MKDLFEIINDLQSDPEMMALLREAGSPEINVSFAATHEIAKAVEIPLRKGVLFGNIYSDLFQSINFDQNSRVSFPLDFLSPGTEKNYVAYSIPNHGRIPERHIEGDEVTINTYETANSIDWLNKYSRDARWDVAARAIEVLRAGFVKKFNDDAFYTILAAA